MRVLGGEEVHIADRPITIGPFPDDLRRRDGPEPLPPWDDRPNAQAELLPSPRREEVFIELREVGISRTRPTPQEAEDVFRKCLEFHPENVSFLNGLTISLEVQGKSGEAVKIYASAAEKDPTEVGIWMNLGRIHTKRGEREDARRAYQRALEIDPSHREIKDLLSRLEKDRLRK